MTGDQPQSDSGMGRERRQHRRHAHFEPTQLVTARTELYAHVLSLSASGALVQVPNGLLPAEGEDATIKFVDGKYLPGAVVWYEHTLLGIEFGYTLASIEEFIWLENRGPDWYRRLLSLMQRHQS